MGSDEVVEVLRGLGVRADDALLVHSSYRSLDRVRWSIPGIIEALQGAVSEGTLLMPALSYATVDADQPVFDVRNTPSCVGAISEVFRTLPGVVRSLHPSHSVAARGVQAGEFTGDHLLDPTPVGPNSPLAKLRDAGGKTLFLGCGLEPNTAMHGVEELALPPYLFLPDPVTYTIVGVDGEVRDYVGARHNFGDGMYVFRQRYDRIVEVLDPLYLRRGTIGPTTCWMVDAAPMWEAVYQALRRDPLFFVDRVRGGA